MTGRVIVENLTGDPDTYPNGVDLDVTIETNIGIVIHRGAY